MPLKPIKKHIEHFALAFIKGFTLMFPPKLCFIQSCFQQYIRIFNGFLQGFQKADQPLCNIQIPMLRNFQLLIIHFALFFYSGRHRIKSGWPVFASGKQKFCQARAIRPLPSSKGCKITNHKWVIPALITLSVESLFTKSNSFSISPSKTLASGA